MGDQKIQILLKLILLVLLLAFLAHDYGLWAVKLPQLPDLPDFNQEQHSPIAIDNTKKTDDITLYTNLPNLGPVDLSGQNIYQQQYGIYKTDSRSEYDLFEPFLNIASNSAQNHLQVTYLADKIVLASKLGFDQNKYNFISPPTQEEYKFSNGEVMRAEIQYTKSLFHDSTLFTSFKQNIVTHIPANKSTEVECKRYLGDKVNGRCMLYDAPHIEEANAYFAELKDGNVKNTEFFIREKTSKQIIYSTTLSSTPRYFVIPPKNTKGIGYEFIFKHIKQKDMPILTVSLLPYKEIRDIQLVAKDKAIPHAEPYDSFAAEKNNIYTYTVNVINTSEKPVSLVLQRPYNEGWKAYEIEHETHSLRSVQAWNIKQIINNYFPSIFGKEIKTHFIVNSQWNGWDLDMEHETWNMKQIKLVYWPIYRMKLVALGVGVALILIIGFVVIRRPLKRK